MDPSVCRHVAAVAEQLRSVYMPASVDVRNCLRILMFRYVSHCFAKQSSGLMWPCEVLPAVNPVQEGCGVHGLGTQINDAEESS